MFGLTVDLRRPCLAGLAVLLAVVAAPTTARAYSSMGGRAAVRLVDMSSDAQAADFYLDGARAWSGVSYKTVSNYIDVGAGNLTDQERLAVTFIDLLSADHHAIDAAFYGQLAQVFTAAQIVELGFTCAGSMGIHRFLHTLEIFGTDDPVVAYSPDQVDTRRDEDASVTADAVAV